MIIIRRFLRLIACRVVIYSSGNILCKRYKIVTETGLDRRQSSFPNIFARFPRGENLQAVIRSRNSLHVTGRCFLHSVCLGLNINLKYVRKIKWKKRSLRSTLSISLNCDLTRTLRMLLNNYCATISEV